MVEKKWEVKSVGSRQSAVDSIKEVVKTLLENRGFESEEEINKFLNPPYPSEIPLAEFGISEDSLDKAVQVVTEAMRREAPIIIHGDYDVDGITAAAILWETIYRDLGYKKCLPFIPNRFEHGYGLSRASVDEIRDTVIPRYRDTEKGPLLITVDCGITATDAIRYAQSMGFEVLVTDHHQRENSEGPKEEGQALKPPGLGPKIPPEPSPKSLAPGNSGPNILWTEKICGAGIAWLVASRLADFGVSADSPTRRVGEGKPDGFSSAEGRLDLVALGTVADVQPLLGPNRSFVKYGLRELNQTSRVGLQELIKVAGIGDKELGVYEVGWVISPRLNAAGRLGSAMDSLRLLCTEDRAQAQNLAGKLNRINRERQDKTEEMVETALRITRQKLPDQSASRIETGGAHLGGQAHNASRTTKIVVVSHESYHEGIIGLLAGRLVKEFYRPAVVIAKGGKLSKGSARSVMGFNIIEALREVGDLLEDVGGHPMAAGFTIRTEKIKEFKERFLELGEASIDDALLQSVLKIDCQVPLSLVSWDLWENVNQFKPFGYANPRPLFLSREVGVVDTSAVGNGGKHLKLKLQDTPALRSPASPALDSEGRVSARTRRAGRLGEGGSENPPSNQCKSVFSAIGFGLGHRVSEPHLGDVIDIVYSLAENKWDGQRSLELKIKDLRKSGVS